MRCTKHPAVEMTALFTSWVCDICDPPKQASVLIDFDLTPDETTSENLSWQPCIFVSPYDDIDLVFDDAFGD